MNWGIIGLVLTPIIGLLGWLAWDVFLNKDEQLKVKINLYDKTNDYYSFRKSFKAKIQKDKVLGDYFKVKKYAFFMSEPGNDYYIPSKKINILNVVRYGVDDFRPMKILKGKGFYKYVEEPDMELIETINEETGETIQTVKQRIDPETSKPIFKKVKKYFEEPLAVSTTDKEVARFGRNYYRRMDELSKGQEGFLQQHLPNIISLTVVIAFFLFIIIFSKMENKTMEAQTKYWADKFDENAQEAIQAINQPNFIESIADRFTRNEVNKNAPVS